MANKKKFRPVEFAIAIGDGKNAKQQKLEIWRPAIDVPGKGIFTAKDLVKKENEAVLANLVRIGSGAIRLVTEKEALTEDDKSDADVIETLKAEVSKKDAEIAALKKDVAERDVKIATMDDEIVSLKSAGESKDSVISEQAAALLEQSKKIVALEDRIAKLNDAPPVDDSKKGGK